MARRDLDLRVVHDAHQKTAGGLDGLPSKDRQVDAGRRACFPPDRNPKTYVCGPTPFVGGRLKFFWWSLGHERGRSHDQDGAVRTHPEG